MGWGAALALRGLFATLKVTGHAEAPGIDPGRPTLRMNLYALWHDSIMIPIALKGRSPEKNVAALVSRHQDGSYLTEFMRHAGIRSVRGSTNHGGGQALLELLRVSEKYHIFITPDGPRGPRRQLKMGIVFLASQTGMPIIPVASRCANAWRIAGSWTDLEIPKPFSRAQYLLGAPIHVPPNLSREALESHRAKVQSEMERLERQLEQLATTATPEEPRRAA